MEFSYPFDIKDAEKKLYKNNESGEKGLYPIGLNHFWHGGIHLKEEETDGKKEPVRAIADGKVIAYRIAQTSQDANGNEVYPNSFVLIKHKLRTPNSQIFIFYSLYMHLLPWNNYISTDKRPKFFRKPKFKVIYDKDGDGLNLRSEEHWENIIAVMPKGVLVRRIDGSPTKKEWRKKSNFPKGNKNWKPHRYNKFLYTDVDGKEYRGYAYTGDMEDLKNGKWRIKKNEDRQINRKHMGLNVVDHENKKNVCTVIPKDTEIFFKKSDDAIIAHQNNSNEFISLYKNYPEIGKVQVSNSRIDITYENIPFDFDDIVTTDTNNDNYNIKAGEMVGYCGRKMVHLEVFASENEGNVTNNFTAFFNNIKNDNLMKEGWNYQYEFGKDTEFYSKRDISIGGIYPSGTILKVTQQAGRVPFKRTMKVKKIGKADVSKSFFSGSLLGSNYLYLNSTKPNSVKKDIWELTEKEIKELTTKDKRISAKGLNLRQRLKEGRGSWIGGYKCNFFEVYRQVDELETIEYFIKKDDFDNLKKEDKIEGTKRKPDEFLIKMDLNRYLENPEILFPEDKLSTQLISKKLDGNKIINCAPNNKEYEEVEHENNKIWMNTKIKLDNKEAWIEKTELEKLRQNYYDLKSIFNKIGLQNNEQFTNNIVNANKLVLSVEQDKLSKLQAKKQTLTGSSLNPIQKSLISINTQIESQQQRVDMLNSLDTSESLLKPKELKSLLNKYKKYMRFCVPCHPTEWSCNLHQNDKLQVLKQHYNLTDTDLTILAQKLQRFEFWETVSAAGELPTDGENLWFFHPITFVSHMKKLKYGYSDEFKLFVATVYGEAAYSTDVAWKAIAHVIMNRIGNGLWRRYRTVTDIIRFTGFDAYSNSNKRGTEHFQLAMGYLNGEKITTITCQKWDKELKKYVWKTWDDSLNKNGKSTIELIIQNIQDIYLNKEGDFTDGAVFYYSPWALNWLHENRPLRYSLAVPDWALNKKEVVFKNGFKLDRNEDYVNNKSKDDFMFMK